MTTRITLASLAIAAAVAFGGVTGFEPTGSFAPAIAAASGKGPAADLRVALNQLLFEHTTLAASATGAALRGRKAEFAAAADALDMNSQDLAAAIGSVYGKDAGDAFLPLWRKHIGFFVDYTMAKASGSRKKQDKAVNDLVQYSEDFGAFLASANPNLPKDVVAGLVKSHVVGLKDVVDAQAAKNPKLAYQKLREAAKHMQMVADPLADAIAMQFPDKFAPK